MNSDKVIKRTEVEESVVRYRQANHARHMQRYVRCQANQARCQDEGITTLKDFTEELPVEFEVEDWEL